RNTPQTRRLSSGICAQFGPLQLPLRRLSRLRSDVKGLAVARTAPYVNSCTIALANRTLMAVPIPRPRARLIGCCAAVLAAALAGEARGEQPETAANADK